MRLVERRGSRRRIDLPDDRDQALLRRRERRHRPQRIHETHPAFLYDGINRLAPHWPRDVLRDDGRG
jgi:hypothetical protein